MKECNLCPLLMEFIDGINLGYNEWLSRVIYLDIRDIVIAENVDLFGYYEIRLYDPGILHDPHYHYGICPFQPYTLYERLKRRYGSEYSLSDDEIECFMKYLRFWVEAQLL